MSVEWVRLGDVLELQRRLVEPELDRDYVEIGVRSFGRGLFLKEPISGAEIGSKRVFAIEPNDLVVSNIFAWEGAVAVAGDEVAGTVGSHRFMTWTTTQDHVHVPFVAQFFASEAGLELLRAASPGSAGRNRTLSIKNLQDIRIPLPPIDEQRRIAAHLDWVQSISRSMESHAGKFPMTVLPRASAAAIIAAELPMTTVGELASVAPETVHPGDLLQGAAEFVGLEHVHSHSGIRHGSRAIGEESGRKFLFRPGQLTYGYLRPYLNKVWVADRIGLCSVEQFVLDPVDGVDPDLLGHLLRSAHVLDQSVAATNQLHLPRLGLKTLLAMQVPDVRRAPRSLVGRLDALRDRFVRAHELSNEMTALKKGLLPAARNEIFTAMR